MGLGVIRSRLRTLTILGVKHATFILPMMNDFVCKGTENVRVVPIGDIESDFLGRVVIMTSKTKGVVSILLAIDYP